MLGNLCRLFKDSIEKGVIRILLTTTFNQPKVIRNFEKMGVSSIEGEPINPKSFQFKIRRQVQILKASIKKEERQQELKDRKQQGGASDSKGIKDQPKIDLVDPLRLQSDFFLMKGGGGKFFWGRWSITLVAPSPRIGKWVEDEEFAKQGKRVYRWVKQAGERNKYLKDQGTWYSFEAKPEYRENKWNFSGKKPKLAFLDEERNELAVKFQVDEKTGNMKIAKDSAQGLGFMDLIVESIEAAIRFGTENTEEVEELEYDENTKERLEALKKGLFQSPKDKQQWDTDQKFDDDKKNENSNDQERFEKDDERKAREINDKIGDDESKERDINDRIGDDDKKERGINDKIGEDDENHRGINDKIGDDESKERGINDKTGEDNTTERGMNDQIGEDDPSNPDVNDRRGKNEDASSEFNDHQGSKKETPSELNDQRSDDSDSPSDWNDEITPESEASTKNQDRSGSEESESEKDSKNHDLQNEVSDGTSREKESTKEAEEDLGSRFRDEEEEQRRNDEQTLGREEQLKKDLKTEEENNPLAWKEALDQSGQFDDESDVDRDQEADSEAAKAPLDSSVSEALEETKKSLNEEDRRAFEEAETRAKQRRSENESTPSEDSDSQFEDSKGKIKPMDETGPTLSPISLAFMTSELMIHAEHQDVDVANKYCKYLSAALSGMTVELAFLNTEDELQIIGSSHEGEAFQLSSSMKNFLEEMPAEKKPSVMQTSDSAMVVDILNLNQKRVGILAIQGDDVTKVPEAYLMKVGKTILGFLQTLSEGKKNIHCVNKPSKKEATGSDLNEESKAA